MLAILMRTLGEQKYGRLLEKMKNLCHFSLMGNSNSPGNVSMEKCISIITGTHLQHDPRKTKQHFTSRD